MRARITFIVAALSLIGCSAGERRFPMRDAMWRDTDLDPVNARCHAAPTKKDPHHVSCAPAVYESPLYWDGIDSLFFRPLSNALGLVSSGESVDVNALDEVPDSAWFSNRIGAHPMSLDQVARGACAPEQLLDADAAADGTWLIDKGKMEGSTPGFRITVPGKGKYMIKLEDQNDEPERQSASSVIGAAVFHAAGYFTSCEQVLHVRPSVFKLQAGLRSKANFEPEKAFDQRALDAMLAKSTKRGALVRVSASAWLPGFPIGEFRFEGTRSDDPNDIIEHEERRELRGMRVLASWIDRFDAREGNTFDTWMVEAKKAPPDSSPGHVVHYQLDMSETLGSRWAWDTLSRRLGKSYVLDWGDIGRDFVTFGLPLRPWDTAHITPGHEIFGYFNVGDFVADHWKSEYPNAAFTRMNERDAAWMARILAHFTPDMVRELARAGKFSSDETTSYLADVLEKRLERILDRYLTRLSPIAEMHVDGDALCGVDLAEMSRVREPFHFHYTAHVIGGAPLATTHADGGKICVALAHAGDGSYVRIAIDDGVAKGSLVAHVYDLGARGFKLAGLERPSP